MDPDDPSFDLGTWERAGVRDAIRNRRREAQVARDLEWAEERRSRRRPKDGAPLGASFVAVPRVDPQPGEPRFRLVPQD